MGFEQKEKELCKQQGLEKIEHFFPSYHPQVFVYRSSIKEQNCELDGL